jgi:hypothetical protein
MNAQRFLILAYENNAIGFKQINNQFTLWKKSEYDFFIRYFYWHFEYTDNEFRPIGQWASTSREPSELLPLDRLEFLIDIGDG